MTSSMMARQKHVVFLCFISIAWIHSVQSFSTAPSIIQQQAHHYFQPGWPSRLYADTTSAPFVTSTDTDSTTSTQKDFDRLDRIHAVLEALRWQLPTLLTTPLTDASSKTVYDEAVQLVVDDDIVLASSREELVALSTTLVLAVTATNQANSFFGVASNNNNNPQRQQSTDSTSTTTTLQSQMAIDPNVQAIRVQWKVQLPTAGARQSTSSSSTSQPQPSRQLQGVSQLELSPITGKVTTLRLLQVQWNGERLNARAIAESLASLRQLVMAVQKSPFLGSLPSLGSDLLQQLTSTTAGQSSPPIKEQSSLFVVDSLETAFTKKNGTTSVSKNANATNANTTTTMTMIPIDDYYQFQNDGGNASTPSAALPLPGSSLWNQYVLSRQTFAYFCQDTLPILSGNKSIASTEMLQLFSQKAKLLAMDGSELLRGRDPVGNFFHTLASWRKRSSGTWELGNATLSNWNDQEMTIVVDYRATSSLPGSSAPVVIEGTDHFTLETRSLLTNKEDGSNNNNPDPEILIKRIEQKKLGIVSGAGVGSPVSGRSADGLWFMKSLVNALDTGRFTSVGGDSVVMDLLQRVIAGDANTRGGGGAGLQDKTAKNGEKPKAKRKTPPKLPDVTAARVYKIMAGLHQDVPSLFDKDMLRVYQLPPLHEFMTENVELRGYLGETLARGRQAYNGAVGTTFASLKGTIATGGAKLDKEPSVSVELTPEGHVRLTLSVELKVLPLPGGTSDLLNSISRNAISLPSGGFPLKMSIVSEYKIDKESGDIYQHRLVETRINGQLTPGDVVSRWIQTQVASADGVSKNGGPNAAAVQSGLIDAIKWVRSISGRSY